MVRKIRSVVTNLFYLTQKYYNLTFIFYECQQKLFVRKNRENRNQISAS